MARDLKERRIIVTGGGQGMGGAAVAAFAREGARVVSLDRDAARGEAVAADAGSEGRFVRFQVCDVSDEASVGAAVAAAVEILGGLDVLVHAAGVAPGAAAEATSLDAWEEVFAVNARGTFLTNRAVFPHLKTEGGQILNFASAAGVIGLPGKAAYAASKGAVVAWSRTAALEWGRHRITVNCVVPAVRTPMYAATRSQMNEEQLRAHDLQMAQVIPLGGALGDCERDFIPVLNFLASPDAAFMTGQLFAVDGGMLMVR